MLRMVSPAHLLGAMTVISAVLASVCAHGAPVPEAGHWSVVREGDAVVAVGQSRRFGADVTFNLGCFNGQDLVSMVSMSRRAGFRRPAQDTVKAAFEIPSAGGEARRSETIVAVLDRDDATLFLPGEATAPTPGGALSRSSIKVSLEGAGLDGRFEFPLDGYAEAAAIVLKACQQR